MLRKVFLLIIKYVLWFPSVNLFNHWLEQTFLFWFENEGAQLFLIWVIFWILILKLSWVFRGKIDVSLENNSWLPNSAQPARSAQTVENSHSFFNVSYTWYKSLYASILIKDRDSIWKSKKIRNQISTFWPIDLLRMTSITLKKTVIKMYLFIFNLEDVLQTFLRDLV